MAIDFGLKRVGLAVTDPNKIIATALTTVENKDAIRFIKEYSIKEQLDAFVIGYPLNLNGSETHSTQPVEDFIKRLNKHFPHLPVHKEDERLTSKLAVQAMIAGGMKKKDRRNKSNIDKISATIILQSFLENYSS